MVLATITFVKLNCKLSPFLTISKIALNKKLFFKKIFHVSGTTCINFRSLSLYVHIAVSSSLIQFRVCIMRNLTFARDKGKLTFSANYDVNCHGPLLCMRIPVVIMVQ